MMLDIASAPHSSFVCLVVIRPTFSPASRCGIASVRGLHTTDGCQKMNRSSKGR